jgi:hypothetical protein
MEGCFMKSRYISYIVVSYLILCVAALMPAFADYYKGYVAVWRPGSGAQWMHSGISGEKLKSLDASYFAQGLRIVSIDIYDESAFTSNSYTVVWQPGTGGQWWKTGMTINDFKQSDDSYFAQGYRLAALDVQGGEVAAVWRSGSGGQHWSIGMSIEELKANDAIYFKQGYRLKTLKKHGDNKYLAVWQPGSGTQWWAVGKVTEFNAKDTGYFNQGLRLTSLDFNGGYYSAVWRPGTGAQWWHFGLNAADFKAQDIAYFKTGLRFVVVEAKKYQHQPANPSNPGPPKPSCGQLGESCCGQTDTFPGTCVGLGITCCQLSRFCLKVGQCPY